MKIGIIGLGVAGISILREIKLQMNEDMWEDLQITVYTEKESFGTGFPYQPDDESLLINQYTETMSIEPDDPYDFFEWVNNNTKNDPLRNTHLPRVLFGEYLYEKTSRLLDELNVTVIQEFVLSVRKVGNDQYSVESEKSKHVFDSVHLSVGHLAYQDPYDLKGEEHYIYNPYPAYKKLNLETDKLKVGVVGTGLTAIDAFLYIRKHYPNAELTFLSLDGRFSSVRGHEPDIETHYVCEEKIHDLLNKDSGPLRLEQINKLFKKEMSDHTIDLPWLWEQLGEGTLEGMMKDLNHLEELGKFQALIRKMRDCYTEIWNALPDIEKDEFITHYGSKWSNFKAPIPQSTARLLIETISKGDAFLLSDLLTISIEDMGFKAEFKNNSDRFYDYIVNATGQQLDLVKHLELQQPLIQQLLNDDLITPYRYGGVKIDLPSMAAMNQSDERVPGLYVYGQLASGIHFGNSNVEMVAKSAHFSIKDMLARIEKSSPQ